MSNTTGRYRTQCQVWFPAEPQACREFPRLAFSVLTPVVLASVPHSP